MIFDVTVNNLSGSGNLRLDLKSINGIVDSNGNPEAGYIAGESYTLVLPTIGNGTWIQPASGGLWSDPSNWLNAVIADGGNSANFNTIDLTANNTVHLDSPRTVGSMIFGDTDATTPASWLLITITIATNTLTLVGATPTITVNALGSGATTTIGAALVGNGGLNKAGAGTLVLSAPNSLVGVLNVNGGILQLASGGSLNLGNSAVNTALNTRLSIAGGSFTTTGLVSATTSQVVIDSGTAAAWKFSYQLRLQRNTTHQRRHAHSWRRKHSSQRRRHGGLYVWFYRHRRYGQRNYDWSWNAEFIWQHVTRRRFAYRYRTDNDRESGDQWSRRFHASTQQRHLYLYRSDARHFDVS